MSRSRNFQVVLPYADRREEWLSHLNTLPQLEWYTGQLEASCDTGFKHYQLTLGFNQAKSVQTLKNQLGGNANIEECRDVTASIKYCTKCDKRVSNTALVTFGTIPEKHKRAVEKKTSSEIIMQCLEMKSVNEACEWAFKENPDWYMKNQKSLKLILNERINECEDSGKFQPTEFVVPLLNNFEKTVVFVGKTGVGKTQYALAHFGNPLLVKTKEDYARFKPGLTDGIIIDDMNTCSWAALTFLKLVENEMPVTMDIKYGSVRIPANMPKIICCNSETLLWPREMEDETKQACLRRMLILEINKPLYKVSLYEKMKASIVCKPIVIEEYFKKCNVVYNNENIL